MDQLTSFYKSCEDYNRTKDYELVKKSSLELLFIVPYNFVYLENTNAFIVYVCSYVYVSKPDTRAYDIIAKITRIFIKNNSKEYSEVINQYLGALYVYGYDLIWYWHVKSIVNSDIVKAISSIIRNLKLSMNNLCSKLCIKSCYDNIVIGCGTASLVYIKSFPQEQSVLVIEQGQYITYDPVISEGKSFELYKIISQFPKQAADNILNFLSSLSVLGEGTKFMAYYNSNSSKGPLANIIDGRRLYAGTTIGGSSTHNYMQTVSYSKDFFDKVEAIAGRNWSYEAMSKRFESVTTDNYSFTDDKVHYTQEKESTFLTQLLEMIKDKPPPSDVGIPLTFDYNQGYNNVLATTTKMYTYSNFSRCSTPAALLPLTKVRYMGKTHNNVGVWKHEDQNNVTYLANAFVTKINISNCIATSVLTSIGEIRGTKIISSAGTIDSAQILQNSGIGHSLILEKANTPVIIDNKYVGKFYTHYGSFINFELKKELSPIGEPIGSTWSMAFLKLLPQYLSRSIEAIFSLEVAPNLTSIKNFMVTIFIVQPEEHGTINITRSNGEPNIVYNFYNNDKDLELIRATIEYFYNTFKDIAIMTYPNPDVITDSNKLKDFLGSYHYVNNTTTPGTYLSYHMCGSLPVGKVVTNNLRVMGIKNLYVVDNSVWPIIPDGNTEAAALMVGKLFSDYLRRKSNQCPCNR